MKVLLVEDDKGVREGLVSGFQHHGFECATAETYNEGWLRLALGSFSIAVIDVILPGGTGIDLCKRARAQGIDIPILLLTARDSIDDRVYGLESGADDYLIKPFAFEELIARMHALKRRPSQLAESELRIADVVLNQRTHVVTRAGKVIELTAKEFALLELFMLHPGRTLSRAAILSYVWDENYDPVSNTVDVLVRRLREKLDDSFPVPLIRTLRGLGYQFSA